MVGPARRSGRTNIDPSAPIMQAGTGGLSEMIDRILAPAGIGNEEAIMNAPYSLADSSSIDTAESHSHLSVGEIPDSGHRLRSVELRS